MVAGTEEAAQVNQELESKAGAWRDGPFRSASAAGPECGQNPGGCWSRRIAEFYGAGADQKVRQRKIDTLGSLFPTEASCDFGSRFGDRVNRDGGLQFVEEGAASVAKLRRSGAVDAMADFRNADGAQYNRNLSNRSEHTSHSLGCGTIPPFGGDQDAGVED